MRNTGYNIAASDTLELPLNIGIPPLSIQNWPDTLHDQGGRYYRRLKG